MNNFFLTVGIEIHTQVNTKTKMFSNTSICNDTTIENINKFVNEYDLGMPGVLPSINEEVIKKAIIFANALEMKINKNLRFDRKNYYYQDLPKGYQITQNFFPFAIEGKIKISNKSIGINRFHLEEDTAKQIIDNEKIILDYNRSGIPLIEIVSEPEMHSSDEVIEYLQKIKQILTFLEISDGEMENSSLRVDVNISVSKNNLEKGIRVEIKNLNSFSNVRDAINYEFERQVKLINSGSHVDQETRK
jgi:aspartyl-tRNA(Asn)/glutamyl-tRNA(Gln) amidotransferase subunit B